MTGFASGQGEGFDHRWSWDIRSVNGRGLELRFRLPDWIDGLEAMLREILTNQIKRGNVTVSLRVQSNAQQDGTVTLNHPQMMSVLEAMLQIEEQASAMGLSLAPANAAQIVGQRGVLEMEQTTPDTEGLKQTLVNEFTSLVTDFVASRAAEGRALEEIIGSQINQIESLTKQAADLAEARKDDQADRLKQQLARVTGNVEDIDPARIAQELALIAVKSDVTEEIDRLGAHVATARDLVQQSGAVGRKLDFLMQEFNREANTLCSKSGFAALTTVGLELKTVIDQMREQVQNLE